VVIVVASWHLLNVDMRDLPVDSARRRRAGPF